MSSEHPSSREERLHAILAAYLTALEAGQSPDREGLLRQHPDLAADLQAFFTDHDRMDRAAAGIRARLAPTAPEAPPRGVQRVRYLGDYELLEELGRGGMGVVYKAQQRSLNRLVAVKMILSAQFAASEEVERFRREAQALAQLDHPGIVPLYEIGEHEGHRYFSMKWIDGNDLSRDLPHFQANHRAAAYLLARVARAVDAAHRRNILHRDLKPGNILLDANKQPHVTDFGLAKRLDGVSSLSPTGAVVGTPRYMAPEQAAARTGALSPAADIYSLGAIFYEMLTGQPPFQAETPLQTLRQVMEREPVPPRQLNPKIDRDLEIICLKCLDKRPQHRYRSAEKLAEDLEYWIRGKPIRARSVSRAEHLWLWCRRKPALAGLAAAVVILAVVASGLGIRYSLMIAEEQHAQQKRDEDARQVEAERLQLAKARLDADRAAEEAAIDQRRQQALAQAAEERRLQDLHLREEADRAAASLRLNLLQAEQKARAQRQIPPAKPEEVAAYLVAMRRAALQAERQQTDELRRTLDRFRPKPGQPDLRSWEWHFLHALERGQESSPVRLLCRMLVHDLPQGPAGSPEAGRGKDSWLLAMCDTDGNAHIFDAATGKQIRVLANVEQREGAPWSATHTFRFSPDGRWLVQLFHVGPRSYASDPYQARLWDVSTGAVVQKFAEVSGGLSWSPDGRRVFLGGSRVWDLARSSELRLKGRAEAVSCASWSPDGARLATVSGERTVRLWDPATGEEDGAPISPGHAVGGVAWSPAGKWIAVSEADAFSVWNVQTRAQMWRLHREPIAGHADNHSMTWSSDGRRLVVCVYSFDHFCRRLIDGATGREIFSADGGAAYCPDGKRLALLTPLPGDPGKKTPAILLVDTDTGQEVLHFDVAEGGALTWSPDGRCLALSTSTMLQVWRIVSPAGPNGSIALQAGGAVAWSPDGLRCAVPTGSASSGQVRIQSLLHPEAGVVVAPRDRARTMSGSAIGQIMKLAWSPDGKYLATAHGGGATYLWDVASGKRLWRLGRHTKAAAAAATHIWDLTWAPRGRWLASAANNGTVKVWDTVTGKEALHFDVAGNTLAQLQLSWSGDGRYLAASEAAGIARVWELPAGKIVHSLKTGIAGGPAGGVMSPDRKILAAAVVGGVKLWDLATGQELPPLESGDRAEKGLRGDFLAWSPDSHYLVYAGIQTYIWDVQARTCTVIRRDHPGHPFGRACIAAWDPEGKKVLLGVEAGEGWQFPELDAQTGEKVRDRGKVLVGVGGQKALPQLLWTRDGPKLAVAHEIEFGSQGPRLLVYVGPHTLGGKSAEQGAVEVVDLGSGQSRFTARVLEAEPIVSINVPRMAFAWKPDGTALATVHGDAVLRLWHPVTGQQLRRLLSDGELRDLLRSPTWLSRDVLACSPDGKRIAYYHNNAMQVWSLVDEWNKTLILAGSGRRSISSFRSLAWSPDNRRLAALMNRGHDAVVKIWDVATWKETRSFSLEGKAGPGAADLLCWSPDGRRLAAGVQSIHVWDAETGNEAIELVGHTTALERLEWSDDGHRIISRGANRPKGRRPVQELIVWDAETGDQILRLGGAAVDYRVSPDGTWMAIPAADNSSFSLQHLSDSKE